MEGAKLLLGLLLLLLTAEDTSRLPSCTGLKAGIQVLLCCCC